MPSSSRWVPSSAKDRTPGPPPGVPQRPADLARPDEGFAQPRGSPAGAPEAHDRAVTLEPAGHGGGEPPGEGRRLALVVPPRQDRHHVLRTGRDHHRDPGGDEELADHLRESGDGRFRARERCRPHGERPLGIDAERAQPAGDLGGAAAARQHHLQQLAGEPQLDRLHGLLLGDLQAEEAGRLVQRVLLGAGQGAHRTQADQRRVHVADGADQVQRRPPGGAQVKLQGRGAGASGRWPPCGAARRSAPPRPRRGGAPSGR
ncbi:hypothetical protein LUX57_02110 [Actinomadura madurae]|nr:hypothetical protein [Actinomadura madurae]MCP9964137.1 hypothetical protein [Actinomadura madurae]